MLKFNINAILQIKKLQTVITRKEKTKKAAEKKTKKLSAQLKKNLNNAEDAESKAAQIWSWKEAYKARAGQKIELSNAKTDEKRSINDSEIDGLKSACVSYGRKFAIND